MDPKDFNMYAWEWIGDCDLYSEEDQMKINRKIELCRVDGYDPEDTSQIILKEFSF